MQGGCVERLDHLGIVAGICRAIGVAQYLEGLAGPSQQQVSIGAATVAMLLNGLGFSKRRLDLVSQFVAPQPVEHLLGAGLTAELVPDDCLGRTLDWRHDHDLTGLFAAIARQARQRFGIAARQVHVDTTSFAVTGEYDTDLDAHTIAVTYGYARQSRQAAHRPADHALDVRVPRRDEPRGVHTSQWAAAAGYRRSAAAARARGRRIGGVL
jgi:transposase